MAEVWSSDALISASLQSAYGGNLFFFGPASGGSQPAVSKEVKDALGDEVKRQLALDKNAAENAKRNAAVSESSTNLVAGELLKAVPT